MALQPQIAHCCKDTQRRAGLEKSEANRSGVSVLHFLDILWSGYFTEIRRNSWVWMIAMGSLLISNLKQHLVVLILGLSLSEGTNPPSTLRHVNIVYRHGDRSPYVIYPNDINTLDLWPDGLGWLTSKGVKQHYELGQYIRNRYAGFINVTRFNHNEVVIESSAVRRCLMSAYANLAGMFPPQGDQVWDPSLLWQPIPVTSVPKKEDKKLAMGAKCPRFDQLYEETFRSEVIRQKEEEQREFLDFIAQNAGTKKESMSTLWEVGDALVCEKSHNMTMNDFVYVNDTYDRILELTDFAWDYQYNSVEKARLSGGPLLGEMLTNLNAASKDKDFLPRMHIYSAHDSTLSAVMSAMSIPLNGQSHYASALFIELHEENRQHVLKMYFRNETKGFPHPVFPEGCGDPCKLSTFERIATPRIPVDWVEECKARGAGGGSQLVLAGPLMLCALVASYLFSIL